MGLKKIKIAVFASGSGTNAENIARYFENSEKAEVAAIFCNNKKAYVIERAQKLNIPVFVFNKDELENSDKVMAALYTYQIEFIVLAGFMWLLPKSMIENYRNKIVNIHPALLPRFGGKGMYGEHVHRAVKNANIRETGITIHYVNEQYDEGQIIFQAKCPVLPEDSPGQISMKVHELEYRYYPEIISQLITKIN